MTQEEILNSNKLIAEFVGAEKCNNNVYEIYNFPEKTKEGLKSYDVIYLEYHSSWDWLMPVVEKISELPYIELFSIVTNCGCDIYFKRNEFKNGVTFYSGNVENSPIINMTYSTVIKFINWYNQQIKMKVALIDADSIIHIVSYHNAIPTDMLSMLDDSDEESKEAAIQALYETKDKKAVLDHVDSFVNDILNETDSSHYIGFLGAREGSDTFRHKLAVTKPYKGQRAKTAHWVKYWKPIIVEHLVSVWKFNELHDVEADDGCSICANLFKDIGIDYTVCSPDKDLKQIPGNHYDYKKCELDYIDEYNALLNLYKQLLKGDSTDNIIGCKGVGEKSPHMQFPGCTTEPEFRDYAYKVYKSKGQESIFEEQLSLVYMLRLLDNKMFPTIPVIMERPSVGTKTGSIEQTSEVEIPIVPPTMFMQ